ncbi:hypothetical protein ACOMHN_012429 [Nucella lapillus]
MIAKISTYLLLLISSIMLTTTTTTATSTPDDTKPDLTDDAKDKGGNATELGVRLERVRRQVEWLKKDNEQLTERNEVLSRALREEEQARNSAVLTIQQLLKDVHELRQRVQGPEQPEEEQAGDHCKDGTCSREDL